MTTMTRKFDISNPFGAVWGASGVQGFFGEGYPFHSILKRFCPGFLLRISFVAKTATLDSRPGNMPLSGITPTERLPKCVWASHRKGIALNAVGLSNPGLEALLLGKFKGVPQTWQERDKPFQISIMSTAQTSEARLRETKDMLGLIGRCATDFQSEFGIQINISCPNVSMSHRSNEDTVNETLATLDLAKDSAPGIRIIVKLSPTFPPESVHQISRHPACWGIVMGNTVPWRSPIPWLLEESGLQINWDDLFGKDEKSPLQKRGLTQAGGLSGRPLLPIICEWIQRARGSGVQCHLNGGGGILHPKDVCRVFDAGADSISLGSIAFLRPWRLAECITESHLKMLRRFFEHGHGATD
ncbi:MAG: hypothetical protein QY304_01145 [Candidatus Paceibacterota bacterium]|nr:MAG: hypothetical protein QY304_01145 [Candidatus Paceibacterota bacterium]